MWNNTSKPFVCHTWGPQMDSHHTVDWKCMLIYTSFPRVPSIALILPAMKWPRNCPCCPHSTNLPSPAFDDTRHDVMFPHHPSHVARRWLFEIAHAPYAYFILPLPSITVEAMNNTSFIILLQEICNTWNRMQYAVYLHARRTQGASVASVCVTRREGKKREQRKQACVTPDSPSASRSNYSPSWGFGRWSRWRPLCVSTHLNKGCVIFKCVSVLCVAFSITVHI